MKWTHTHTNTHSYCIMCAFDRWCEKCHNLASPTWLGLGIWKIACQQHTLLPHMCAPAPAPVLRSAADRNRNKARSSTCVCGAGVRRPLRCTARTAPHGSARQTTHETHYCARYGLCVSVLLFRSAMHTSTHALAQQWANVTRCVGGGTGSGKFCTHAQTIVCLLYARGCGCTCVCVCVRTQYI